MYKQHLQKKTTTGCQVLAEFEARLQMQGVSLKSCIRASWGFVHSGVRECTEGLGVSDDRGGGTAGQCNAIDGKASSRPAFPGMRVSEEEASGAGTY